VGEADSRDKYEAETNKDQDNRILANLASRKARRSAVSDVFCFLPATALQCSALGTTEAVDLFSGKPVWDVPFGTLIPGQQTGTINLGGPMITAGGLVFTSAAMDFYLRAFDVNRERALGNSIAGRRAATPMTYTLNGKHTW